MQPAPVHWLFAMSRAKLVGMLSDGDLRRALLRGHPLEDACVAVACTKPIIVSSPASAAHALQLMNEFDIHQLPVVDDQGVLVNFLLRKDVVEEYQLEVESRDRLHKVCIAAAGIHFGCHCSTERRWNRCSRAVRCGRQALRADYRWGHPSCRNSEDPPQRSLREHRDAKACLRVLSRSRPRMHFTS